MAACALYVAALFVTTLPPPGLSVVLFAAAPLCACFALPVLQVRAKAEDVPALSWVAGGLLVAVVAMTLQLISFVAVSPAGGPLGTDSQSNAGLYLLFHLAFAGAAAAGALGVGPRWRAPLVTAGVVLALLVAVNAIPLPYLLRPDGSYTSLLVAVEVACAGIIAACTVGWIWRTGLEPQPLRGWVAVALSLSTYDVVLNAVGHIRFSPVWWASLSLRGATYAVLAGGAVWTILAKLADLESYTGAELDRREGQLLASVTSTRRLLVCAQDLAEALTPADVARTLSTDAAAAAAAAHAAVITAHLGDRLRVVGAYGYDAALTERTEQVAWDAPMPSARALLTGQSIFLSGPEQVQDQFPAAEQVLGVRVRSVAALPILVRGEPIAALVVWDGKARGWSPMQREVLTGLAAQGGQALDRAQAYQDQATAATTLQESLLPSRLPSRPDLQLATRYVPGERGLRVGGDWYDCIEVGDHLVALVVGDVMGKGLHAAAVMGQLRTTLRTLTRIDPAPAAVLTAMNRATQDLAVDEIATVVYVLLDLSTGHARVARAGHLPPLLAHADGQVSAVYAGGSPPLGVPDGHRGEAHLVIAPGSVLVLYSDGMVEDRQTGLEPGLSRLTGSVQWLVHQHGADVGALAAALLPHAKDLSREDDATLLLARRPD